MTDNTQVIDGLFFDLYGTLMIYGDMDRAWAAWLEELHRAFLGYGLNLSRNDFGSRCRGLFDLPVPDDDDSGLTIYELRLAELAGEVDLDLRQTQLSDAAARSIAAWHEFVTLDPTVPALLERFGARVPLALISNFDHPPHIHRMLDALDIRKRFANVTVSADVGVAKPDPRIFEGALADTGLDPSRVAYVGDTDDDMTAAAAAGMMPILIRRGGDGLSEAGQDYGGTASSVAEELFGLEGVVVIRSLEELSAALAISD